MSPCLSACKPTRLKDKMLISLLHLLLKRPLGFFNQIITIVASKIPDLSREWKKYYCFFRGHGNESCNLIGSLPGQYFPNSAHGPQQHFLASPSTSQISLSFFHKYTSFCPLGSIFKQTHRSLPQADK